MIALNGIINKIYRYAGYFLYCKKQDSFEIFYNYVEFFYSRARMTNFNKERGHKALPSVSISKKPQLEKVPRPLYLVSGSVFW